MLQTFKQVKIYINLEKLFKKRTKAGKKKLFKKEQRIGKRIQKYTIRKHFMIKLIIKTLEHYAA